LQQEIPFFAPETTRLAAHRWAQSKSPPTEILNVFASFTSVLNRKSFSPRSIAPVNDLAKPL
jgi:hypothetical protein